MGAALDHATPRITTGPGSTGCPGLGAMMSADLQEAQGLPVDVVPVDLEMAIEGRSISSMWVNHFAEATAYQLSTIRRSGYPWCTGSCSPLMAYAGSALGSVHDEAGPRRLGACRCLPPRVSTGVRRATTLLTSLRLHFVRQHAHCGLWASRTTRRPTQEASHARI
jgi:hypothetical protein